MAAAAAAAAAATTTYAPGDVVQLKSGGPAMTVVEAAADGSTATCLWWHEEMGDYAPSPRAFPAACLVAVNAPKPKPR